MRIGILTILSILLFGLCTCIVLMQCSDEQKGKQLDIENTSWQTLENEDIQILLPNYFKRSSRYRIKEDLPFLQEDVEVITNLENVLQRLESLDSEIDVYIDTTQRYRIISISNTEQINFDETDSAVLRNHFIESLRKNKDPNVKIGETTTKFNRTANHIMVSFQVPYTYTSINYRVNYSNYFITGHGYSLAVTEISDSELNVKDYLWTIKRN